MKTLIKTFLLLLIVLIGTQGFCKDYYVDASKNPSDPNCDGTLENPWPNITTAISRVTVSENDPAVIHVASGTYNLSQGEIFPIDLNSHISLIGESRDNTVVDGELIEGSLFSVEYKGNITIETLTLTGGMGKIPTRY